MGPVLLVVLASYALFKIDFYRFEQGGAVSGSEWLMKFGYAYNVKPPSGLWDALQQGALPTFFRGDHYYDASLWTMQPEFVGSFVAFGFAPILFAAKKLSLLLTVGVIAIASVVADHVSLNRTSLIEFPIGVGLLPWSRANRRCQVELLIRLC